MKVIIPMSGVGQRFINEGYKNPKPLIEVDGYPMIKHVIDLFPDEDDFIFICNEKHLRETKIKYILLNLKPKAKIYSVPNEGRKGPVHAVSLIFKEIDDQEEVIISYCDYGTVWKYQEFLKDTRERGCHGAIACYKGFHPHMLGSDNYAFLKEEEEGSRYMSEIKEKEPFTNDRMNEYASNGTYYFQTAKIMKKYFQELMDKKIEVKGEYYVSMVYNLLVKDGLKVNIFEIEKMLQWGTPYDLEIYKGWSNYFYKLKHKKQIKFIDRLDTTLILPMAGRGSRFGKEGYKKPKPLLDIDGQTMVVKAVDCLPTTTNKIFITLEEHKINYFISNYYKCRVYSINDITEGQACTCEIALKNFDLEKPILISACDNGVYYDVEKYQKLVDDESVDIIVWSFRNQQTSKNNPDMYAWLDVDEKDNIRYVSCKKFIYDDPLKTHAIIGTMFFRKAKYFIDGLKENYKHNIKTNNEYYVDDVINQNIKMGLKVKVFEVEDYICWGTPNDYKTYNYWKEYFN